jgi:hypothetical protein
MADRKPRGLRPWLDDIQLDGSGKYAYKGSHMKFAGDEAQRKRFLLTLGLSMGGAAVCTVAAGCLDVGDADNTMYVLIPYMIEVIAAVAFVWSSVRLLLGGSVLRSYVFNQTVKRLPVLAAILALGAAATLVGAAVFLILHQTIDASTAVYLFLHAAVCALSLLGWKALRSAEWESIE